MLRGNHVLDLVEELRVRQWARRNWVPAKLRDSRWHHVIHEEMSQRDRELGECKAAAARIVPLAGEGPKLPTPHFLQIPARSRALETADEFASFEPHYG
jgi:hypothetical protein